MTPPKVYKPRVCHRCDGRGTAPDTRYCPRCNGSGFTVGPDHAPVPLSSLEAPQRNWRYRS